jgi:hypothetical protein
MPDPNPLSGGVAGGGWWRWWNGGWQRWQVADGGLRLLNRWRVAEMADGWPNWQSAHVNACRRMSAHVGACRRRMSAHVLTMNSISALAPLADAANAGGPRAPAVPHADRPNLPLAHIGRVRPGRAGPSRGAMVLRSIALRPCAMGVLRAGVLVLVSHGGAHGGPPYAIQPPGLVNIHNLMPLR